MITYYKKKRCLLQISCLFTYYTTPPLSALLTEPSGCHAPIFKQQYVAAKVVLHQPNKLSTSCCHVATSERRHIQSKADTRFFALREASIRRSRWDNTLTITLHQPYLRHFPFHSFFQSTQPINNVIFHYVKKHCKNSCLNCVNIVKYICLSGRKLAKCKNISNLACT